MKSVTVGWFEIPVSDMNRAMKFYEFIFNVKLQRNTMGDLDMAWFPWDESGSGAGGSLVYHAEFYHPSEKGVTVYFNTADIETELSRVEEAGGKVLMAKKEIAPDIGYMALFMDTEGNRLALHSRA